MHFQGETRSGGDKDRGSKNAMSSFHTLLEEFTNYNDLIIGYYYCQLCCLQNPLYYIITLTIRK
jgi:hypothetical protein